MRCYGKSVFMTLPNEQQLANFKESASHPDLRHDENMNPNEMDTQVK